MRDYTLLGADGQLAVERGLAALRALHDEIKAALPAASPSIAAAFREFVPVLIQQRKDDNVFIRRQLPSIAPHGAAS